MKTLGLFIEREFLARVAKRGYWIFTLLGVVLMVGLVFLSSIMHWVDDKSRTKIAVADPRNLVTAALMNMEKTKPEALGLHFVIAKPADLKTGSNADIDAYLKNAGAKALLQVNGQSSADVSFLLKEDRALDPGEVQSLQSFLLAETMQQRLQSLDASSRQVMSSPLPVELQVLNANAKSSDELIQSKMLVYCMEILLMITLTLYGTWVAQGLIEEKSNRIVEMLLVAAKPWHVLFGKVLGVGLVAVLQYVIWLGAVAVATTVHSAGSISLSHVSMWTLIGFPVFFILGYLLYATLYGIGGSLVYRSEEQQVAIAPIQILMVVSCYTAMAVLINPDSTFAVVVSLIPFCAPLAMFARVALTHVPVWQCGVSLLLSVLAIWAAVRIGERVYRKYALRTSGTSGWKLLTRRVKEEAPITRA